jgi:hypothetical protein
MSINPDDFGVGHKSFHASYRANSLRMVSSKNDWEIAAFKSVDSLVAKVDGRLDNVVYILSIDLFLI